MINKTITALQFALQLLSCWRENNTHQPYEHRRVQWLVIAYDVLCRLMTTWIGSWWSQTFTPPLWTSSPVICPFWRMSSPRPIQVITLRLSMYNASPKAKQKPYISIILRIQMILQNSLLSDKIELKPLLRMNPVNPLIAVHFVNIVFGVKFY